MSQEPTLDLTTAPSSMGFRYLLASGHLGWGADAKIKKEIAASPVEAPAADSVVLNLSDVTFIDSAGISSLLSIQNELSDAGGKMVLCSVPPLINQTFQVVGMSRLIPVVDDVQQAGEVLSS